MVPENNRIPDWAHQERQGDLAWIRENLDVFWTAAKAAFEDAGRGVVVVDTSSQPVDGAGYPFGYLPQELAERFGGEDVNRMMTEYDPAQELVFVLIKPHDRTSIYRVRALRFQEAETPTDPELEPPDLETLMEWEAEGGCEAACPHRCWVEPDGTCSHGNPSWLLKLGLI